VSDRKIPEGLRHALAVWHDLFSTPVDERPPAPAAERSSAPVRLAQDLLEVARLDTVYADLYLGRARELLRPEMSEAEFSGLREAQTEAANLPNRIRNAMQVEAWDEVRSLSARLSTLNRTLSESEEVRAVAKSVYDFDEHLVDPFSLGLSQLAGVLDADLPRLREQACAQLARLREADPAWQSLYGARHDALAGMQLPGVVQNTDGDAPLREQVEQAFTSGDFERVEALASRLASDQAAAPAAAPPPGTQRLPDLSYAFSSETVARAARLGLSPVHVGSARSLVQGVYQHAWRPTVAGGEEAGHGAVRVPVRFAPHTPAALQERLELYLHRPFVNSGGARHLPYLVREDLLVETFDEPEPGAPPANRALLEALGLPARNGLSRVRIERALLARGADVVRGLGLDPPAFRLVCIPSDLHVRIGHKRGWGSQPMWTHLDGWMVLPGRRFLALAGGDVRFGGIYDMVGVGNEYDSERLFSRFAVVLRRRMTAW
jgi:hypothetical protein